MSESSGENAMKLEEEELGYLGISSENIGLVPEKVSQEPVTEEPERFDLVSKDVALNAQREEVSHEEIEGKEQVLPLWNSPVLTVDTVTDMDSNYVSPAVTKELLSAEEKTETTGNGAHGGKGGSCVDLEGKIFNQQECECESTEQPNAGLMANSEANDGGLVEIREMVDVNGGISISVTASETGSEEDANSESVLVFQCPADTHVPGDVDGTKIAGKTAIEGHIDLLEPTGLMVDTEIEFMDGENHVLQQEYENGLVPEENNGTEPAPDFPSDTQLPDELVPEVPIVFEYLNSSSQFVSSEVLEENKDEVSDIDAQEHGSKEKTELVPLAEEDHGDLIEPAEQSVDAEKVGNLNCENHDLQQTYEKGSTLNSNIIAQFVSPEASAENKIQESETISNEQGSDRNELILPTNIENQFVSHDHHVEDGNYEKISAKDDVNGERGDLSTDAGKENSLVCKDLAANFEGKNQEDLQVQSRALEFDPNSVKARSLSNHIGESLAKEAEATFSLGLSANITNKKGAEETFSPIQEILEVRLGLEEYRDRKVSFTECCGMWDWIRGIRR